MSLQVIGDVLLSGGDDGTVREWKMQGQAAEWRSEGSLTGHRGGVRCLAACGRKPVSGGVDGTLRVWAGWRRKQRAGVAPDRRVEARVLRGHCGVVSAVAEAGLQLVSCGMDGTVRVWSWSTGVCLGRSEVPFDSSIAGLPRRT